jgi:hypothetical protein
MHRALRVPARAIQVPAPTGRRSLCGLYAAPPVQTQCVRRRRDDFAGDIYVPGEVLTRWHGLREFVGPDGQPTPLRPRGKGLTFANLVYRIDPSTDPQQVLACLLKIGAVAQVGSQYLPRARKAVHCMKTRTFNFKATLALLRAAERNVRANRPLEYQTATYGSIPTKQVADFRKATSILADSILISADEAMLRETNSSPPGARAVPMTLGVHTSESRPLRSLLAKRPTISNRKKARR